MQPSGEATAVIKHKLAAGVGMSTRWGAVLVQLMLVRLGRLRSVVVVSACFDVGRLVLTSICAIAHGFLLRRL